jgi:hypothetical protein
MRSAARSATWRISSAYAWNDRLRLEQGRHQLALSPPERALAGEQPLPGQRLQQHAEAGALLEALRLGDQHLVRGLERARKDRGQVQDPAPRQRRVDGGQGALQLHALRRAGAEAADERVVREAREVVERGALECGARRAHPVTP